RADRNSPRRDTIPRSTPERAPHPPAPRALPWCRPRRPSRRRPRCRDRRARPSDDRRAGAGETRSSDSGGALMDRPLGAAPGVSVVVVSHNEGENLGLTVDSLLAALPDDAEVVVVDDVSTDGSIEALPEGRVRVVRPEARLGIAAARNLGAARSRGEVIVFSDAHVDVPPGFLGPLLDELRRPRVAAVGPAVST